jgi:hypothetical protein
LCLLVLTSKIANNSIFVLFINSNFNVSNPGEGGGVLLVEQVDVSEIKKILLLAILHCLNQYLLLENVEDIKGVIGPCNP